jgi:aminomethyltransferase
MSAIREGNYTMAPRETPFHKVGLAAGAEMQDLFGYWLPWQYERGHEAEHRATRERVSVCDLDYMAEFKLTGPDSLRFAQYLFTTDLEDLAVGRVRYTAMCGSDGNMIDDGTVWRLGPDELLYISGDEADLEWLQTNAESFDVQLSNLTSDWTTLAVQGPASRKVLGRMLSADLDSLRYYGFTRTNVGEADCIVARMGYTGEFGFELHFGPAHGEAIWTALMDAGAEDDILPCGQAALESLRQEAGYLLVGNDHDKSTNPFEAGIGRVVRFNKADFSGRRALLDVLEHGLTRTMVWFKLDGSAVVSNGDPIRLDGQTVGTVTSGSYSPTLGRGVAMGYIEPSHAIQGATFDLGPDSQTERAALSVMPLYDPGDVRTTGRFAR